MLSNLNPSWQNFLSEELEKDNFLNLVQEVDEEYQNYICFPPKDLIFSAFNHCSFDKVKVVIIGQDPYHGDGEANGLCFSVNDSVKIPPSLRNIFRELNDDFDTIFMDPPRSGLDDTTRALAKNFTNIIYISCNPQTLHRDLEELLKTHKIVRFALFDQFAYSEHIECGVILEKYSFVV